MHPMPVYAGRLVSKPVCDVHNNSIPLIHINSRAGKLPVDPNDRPFEAIRRSGRPANVPVVGHSLGQAQLQRSDNTENEDKHCKERDLELRGLGRKRDLEKRRRQEKRNDGERNMGEERLQISKSTHKWHDIMNRAVQTRFIWFSISPTRQREVASLSQLRARPPN